MTKIITLSETIKKQEGSKTEGGIWVTKFDEASAKSIVEEVRKLENKEEKPIVVYIDSYGGYVDALASMVGVLDSVKNKVITVCLGKAMSCGAILLSHGDIRFATPSSRIMIHEVSSGSEGNVNDLKNDVAETSRLNKHWQKIIAENCGYSPKEWSALFTNEKRDIYLNPEEARRFGIIDRIGYPKLEEHTTYKLIY